MLKVSCPPDPALVRLLSRHPRVKLASEHSAHVEIDQDGWQRTLAVGNPNIEVAGLVELMDNNPMVCGDAVSVPGPVATLALVALGPLVRAGILLEEPVMQVGGASEGEDVDGFLKTMAWDQGVAVSYGNEDFGGVVAANVVAEIATPGNWEEIDELFRECYARSFYVEESTDAPWDISLVKGTPMALYRLAYTPGDASSLLTVQVMADREGKCGATQVVHALNVMCGFEECDGIPEL